MVDGGKVVGVSGGHRWTHGHKKHLKNTNRHEVRQLWRKKHKQFYGKPAHGGEELKQD